MFLPALEYLKGRVPIIFAGRQPGISYLCHHVEQIIDVEGFGWHRLFMETPDKEGLPLSSAASVRAFFSSQRDRIRKNLMEYFPSRDIQVFPSLPSDKENIHVAFYLSCCLERAGFPVDPEKSMKKALEKPLLQRFCKPEIVLRTRMVFHPGSGGRSKNHTPAFWFELLDFFEKAPEFRDLKMTLLLGPAERGDWHAFKSFLNSPLRDLFFCPPKDVLTNILRQAALYIGHDSGITHLSAMLGTPTVALFITSDHRQWHPLGPKVKILSGKSAGNAKQKAVFRAAEYLLVKA
jgi:hypothetical protein